MKSILNKTILKIVIIFNLLILFECWGAKEMMGNHSSKTNYYIKSSYINQYDLFETLIENPSKLFKWCCDCIQYYASALGLTYEQLNIHLFIIIQPMLILMFLTLFLVQSYRLKN